jgi:hypothetical protein
MRKITTWVAIIAAPTAVTGFFRQNIPYSGYAKQSGFIAFTLIIVSIAAILYVVAFNAKKWCSRVRAIERAKVLPAWRPAACRWQVLARRLDLGRRGPGAVGLLRRRG